MFPKLLGGLREQGGRAPAQGGLQQAAQRLQRGREDIWPVSLRAGLRRRPRNLRTGPSALETFSLENLEETVPLLLAI